MNEIAQFLTDFTNGIGIEGLDFENGETIKFDDVVVNIDIDEKKSLIYLCSEIAPLPEENEQLNVYTALLEQNAFYKGTGFASIGIDKELKAIILTSLYIYHNNHQSSVEIFDTIIGSHVNTVEAFREVLKHISAATTLNSSADISLAIQNIGKGEYFGSNFIRI